MLWFKFFIGLKFFKPVNLNFPFSDYGNNRGQRNIKIKLRSRKKSSHNIHTRCMSQTVSEIAIFPLLSEGLPYIVVREQCADAFKK